MVVLMRSCWITTGSLAPWETPLGGTSYAGPSRGEGVAELAGHYSMSFAAVQKHIAILERAGLVSKHRIGRRKVVRTNLAGLRVARRLLGRYGICGESASSA